MNKSEYRYHDFEYDFENRIRVKDEIKTMSSERPLYVYRFARNSNLVSTFNELILMLFSMTHLLEYLLYAAVAIGH